MESSGCLIKASEENKRAWMGDGRKASDQASGSRETTDQGSPAKRVHEPVDDLGNQTCHHFGASYLGWISVLARLPFAARLKHCRHRIRATRIRIVVPGTN